MVGVGFTGFDYRTLEPLYCDPEPDTVSYLLECGANVDSQDAKVQPLNKNLMKTKSFFFSHILIGRLKQLPHMSPQLEIKER